MPEDMTNAVTATALVCARLCNAGVDVVSFTWTRAMVPPIPDVSIHCRSQRDVFNAMVALFPVSPRDDILNRLARRRGQIDRLTLEYTGRYLGYLVSVWGPEDA